MTKKAPTLIKPPTIGRPTRYQDDYAEQAYRLCLMGATDQQLADTFGVSEQTINTWKKKHPNFLESLNKGKEFADALVAESLYKSAMGLHKISEEVNTDGGVITLERTIPPNTSAQIFWLKNRQPKKWKDKVEIKEDVNINVFPSTEALNAISQKALAEAAERFKFVMGDRMARLGIIFNDDA
jgi:DNA-binding XRE family transcriptional regulator